MGSGDSAFTLDELTRVRIEGVGSFDVCNIERKRNKTILEMVRSASDGSTPPPVNFRTGNALDRSLGDVLRGKAKGDIKAFYGCRPEDLTVAQKAFVAKLREWGRDAAIGSGADAIHLNEFGVEALQYAADTLEQQPVIEAVEPEESPINLVRWDKAGCEHRCVVVDTGEIVGYAKTNVGYGCFASYRGKPVGTFDTLAHAKAAVEKAAREAVS